MDMDASDIEKTIYEYMYRIVHNKVHIKTKATLHAIYPTYLDIAYGSAYE